MKTKSSWKRRLGGALMGLSLIFAGCSDGVLPEPGKGESPQITEFPPPVIVSFEADKEMIDRGGSVMLSWEVSGADSIEITSTSVDNAFHFANQTDFDSQTLVENIMEDTTFILTATKNLPQPNEGGEGEEKTEGDEVKVDGILAGAQVNGEDSESPKPESDSETEEVPPPSDSKVVSASVTVMVRGGRIEIVSFYASAPNKDEAGNYIVAPGERTVLQWSVLPEDAVVTIQASSGEEVRLSVNCDAEGMDEMELEGEVKESFPAKGCASVQPSQDTTYTLNAMVGEETESAHLTVKVLSQLNVEFTVNGDSQGTSVPYYPSEVTLAWKVIPANAKVTIQAEPEVAETELPVGSTETEGNLEVTVQENTVFTLIAQLGGEEERKSVRVSSDLARIDCSQFQVASTATSPVFVGESLKISWSWSGGGTPQFVSQVRVEDTIGEPVTADWGASSVNVTAMSGAYTVTFSGSGGDYCPKVVNLPVAALEKLEEGSAVKVARDTASPVGVYVGLDGNYNGGVMEMRHYNTGGKKLTVPFGELLKGWDSLTKYLTDKFLKEVVQTYPVNAITVSPKNGRLFAATTGAILYRLIEGDSGYKVDEDTWGILQPILQGDPGKVYAGEHPSCFGKMQTGVSPTDGKIVTMNQVCDMAATGDGKLHVALDRGLYTFNNVEDFIKDKGSDPDVGTRGRNNSLHGTVVNDIEVVPVDGRYILYAGGSAGVYRSENAGADWEKVGEGLDKEVYSVTYGSGIDTGFLLVGGANGVSVLEMGPMAVGAGWTSHSIDGVSTVYSVARDPKSMATVYAGTNSGLYVSRDGGASYVRVSAGDTVVRSVGVLYEGDPAKYYIYLATESGLMRAYVPAVKVTTSPLPENPDPSEGPEATPPEDEGEDEEDVEGSGITAEGSVVR